MRQGRTKYGWFDRLELCEFLDVTGHYFDQQIKPHIPLEKIDKSASTYLFYGRTVVEVFAILRTYISRRAREALGSSADRTKPTVNGISVYDLGKKSQATERLRHEQFRIARLERQELEKKLVSRKEVEEGLARLAQILREAGDQMNKVDPRCTEILNDAIEKMEKIEVITTEPLYGRNLRERMEAAERQPPGIVQVRRSPREEPPVPPGPVPKAKPKKPHPRNKTK